MLFGIQNININQSLSNECKEEQQITDWNQTHDIHTMVRIFSLAFLMVLKT